MNYFLEVIPPMWLEVPSLWVAFGLAAVSGLMWVLHRRQSKLMAAPAAQAVLGASGVLTATVMWGVLVDIAMRQPAWLLDPLAFWSYVLTSFVYLFAGLIFGGRFLVSRGSGRR